MESKTQSAIGMALTMYILKAKGIEDPTDLSSIEKAISERDKKIQELETRLRRKKLTKREVKKAIKRFVTKIAFFPKRQRSLLVALSDCIPVEKNVLIEKIPTKDKNSLIKLVTATKKRLVRYKMQEVFVINPLRGNPFPGYVLKTNFHLLK